MSLDTDYGHKRRIPKRYKRQPGEPAAFKVADTSSFIYTIDRISQAGGAVRFGRTRDGGLLSLGCYYDGGTSFTVYCHDADEILHMMTEFLDEITAYRLRDQNRPQNRV